jgi:hypothetical protein
MIEMCQTVFRESIRNKIVESWRVYCLSTHPDNSLMWSHYSNRHRGICVEFDASQPLIGGAWEVEYRDVLPALDMLAVSPKEAFQVLVTKSSDWTYENEYRILARDGRADEIPHPLPVTSDDFLALPPGALRAVIAGCRADVHKVKELVKKRSPGLPVKQAVQAADRYRLSIQDGPC